MRYAAYPTYKPSGIDWLGDIPVHWDTTQLRRDVVAVRNGTSAPQMDANQDCVPVTRIETISDGTIDFDKVGYVQRTPALRAYRLSKGDILLSHINSLPMIGNCAIYDGTSELYSGMNLLRLQPSADIDGRWLWRYLSSAPIPASSPCDGEASNQPS